MVPFSLHKLVNVVKLVSLAGSVVTEADVVDGTTDDRLLDEAGVREPDEDEPDRLLDDAYDEITTLEELAMVVLELEFDVRVELLRVLEDAGEPAGLAAATEEVEASPALPQSPEDASQLSPQYSAVPPQ